MIFSKLFSSKANWQHKDASTRVNSIENELDVSNTQDQQVLRQLIDNDSNELVRRAALIKLDSIILWREKGLVDSANSTVKLAENKIIDFIVSDKESESAKFSLIADINKPLAEKALAQAVEANIVIALLEKVEKPHLLSSVFTQKQIAEIQQYIIQKTEQVSVLEKLAKKSKLPEIVKVIEEKLATIRTLAEKPEKVQKEGQLVLSKLLALKDVNEYRDVVEKREVLESQWQRLVNEFSYLTDEKQSEFVEKYQSISETLNKLFAVKEEQYQQAKIAENLAVQQAKIRVNFTQFIDETAQAITTAIFENDAIDTNILTERINEFKGNVNDSQLSQNDKSGFIKQVEQLNVRLNKIDVIASSVANATHLISKMAQQQPPESLSDLNAKQASFKAWLADWKKNLALAAGVLPVSIIDAFEEIHSNWIKAIAPLEKAQQKQFHQCQRKASDVKRLLATGKYNAAFGVFNKFKQLYAALSEEQQRRLNRDYEHLTAKIAELSDWEHYIATPRKQQLLEEIGAIADTPLDNPSEQAEKVKHYRKTWNSLGHADEEIDKDLNQKFNDACEKAFAPCRQFYADQDKLREQHLALRNKIQLEAEQLQAKLDCDVNADIKKIETQLNQLIKKWREAGEVDRTVYKKVNDKFQSSIKPIKQRVNQYHNDNVDAKLNIIALAEKLLDQDDIFNAVQEIKELQGQWKAIGYAGARKENDLWNKFRAINDKVFAKRSDVQALRQQESNAKLASAEEKLSIIKQRIVEINEPKIIQQAIDDATDLLAEINAEKYPSKDAIKLVERFISDSQQTLKKLSKQKAKQDWQHLFTVLTYVANHEDCQSLEEVEEYKLLSNSMKSRLNSAIKFESVPNANRQLATIELEVIAGIDSPAQDQKLRMEKQIAMMQEKMTSGALMSVEEKFWQWMSVSLFSQQDVEYIERIKPIFI